MKKDFIIPIAAGAISPWLYSNEVRKNSCELTSILKEVFFSLSLTFFCLIFKRTWRRFTWQNYDDQHLFLLPFRLVCKIKRNDVSHLYGEQRESSADQSDGSSSAYSNKESIKNFWLFYFSIRWRTIYQPKGAAVTIKQTMLKTYKTIFNFFWQARILLRFLNSSRRWIKIKDNF